MTQPENLVGKFAIGVLALGGQLRFYFCILGANFCMAFRWGKLLAFFPRPIFLRPIHKSSTKASLPPA